jgi:hypothetical protein
MTKSASLFLAGLALFSVLSSFMFIYYGIGILSGTRLSQPLTIFAYITTGYGLANIYLLSFAWRSRLKWATAANQLLALCYFGIFVFDRFNAGFKGMTGIVAIAAIAAVLAINWLAVKQLVERSR